jgi:hypothetical protein
MVLNPVDHNISVERSQGLVPWYVLLGYVCGRCLCDPALSELADKLQITLIEALPNVLPMFTKVNPPSALCGQC